MADCHSCAAQARRRARQAPRRPAADSRPRHLRRRHQDHRDAPHGVQAQRHRARQDHVDRYQSRCRHGRCRGGLHRRRYRQDPGADADRHAVPVAAASRRSGRHGSLRRRTGRRRRGRGSLCGARRRRCDRRQVRPAARGGRSRIGDDRQAHGDSRRLSQQSCGGTGAERHRRRSRLFGDRQHRGRQGICGRGSGHQPAHDEPAPGAERDGAARRDCALGARQGDR